MSELREQLRSARADYRAVRYPGNLAEEVLPERRRLNWGRWALIGGGFSAGSLAAAAAIALALVNFLPAPPGHEGDVNDVVARVTGGGGGTFATLSQLPARLSHLTTVVPVETLRTTLHFLGLPANQDSPAEDPPAKPARDAAAA
jgi:hypothetical protein